MTNERLADWTTGAEAIAISSAELAGHVQYFRRGFCAACGAPDPVEKRASGEGTVYATSLVCRAATPETRAHVPYNIVLVDTRGLSHDGAWRQRPCHRRHGHRALRAALPGESCPTSGR